jgi:hypothetical protein
MRFSRAFSGLTNPSPQVVATQVVHSRQDHGIGKAKSAGNPRKIANVPYKSLILCYISVWLKFDQGERRAVFLGTATPFSQARPHSYPQLVWIS